ncbi:sialidase family protein [Parafilimonas terrae]|nr:sialidase family protein [Parafilimonas terrae]
MKYFLSIISMCFMLAAPAQDINWKQGIITDEFIYDTAPYPSCHASTIAETPAGLVAAWFGGTAERNPDVCIYVSRMVNNKWQTPVQVADGIVNDSLRYPCWNPVLYQMPGGELLLFYKIGPSPSAWKGWLKRSADNGLTWSAAEALPEGFLGPIKNKPVMVGNKLICPSSTEGNGWRVHLEVTADAGKTWSMIKLDSSIEAIQPSLLTYKDGRMQVVCRTKNRCVASSWSNDNGKTWSALTCTELPNNNSGTDAVTLNNGLQLLVYNHVLPPADAKNGKGARTPLNIALSKDGKQWYASVVLEDSPISQYSYPSVIQSKDGMIHIVYTWRRKKIKYVKIDPSKLQMVEMDKSGWNKM